MKENENKKSGPSERKTPVKGGSSKGVKKSKSKNKKMSKTVKIVIAVFVLVAAVAAAGNIYYRSASKAVNPDSNTYMVVEIPPGSSVKKVGNILEKNGLVKSASVFVTNVKNSGKASMIKAGKYRLSQKMDNHSIIDVLASGKTVKEGIKITIPEGSISTYIVDVLVKNNLGTRENFVKLFRNPAEFSEEFPFLKDKRIQTLEGFLYPQTYYFKKGTTEKAIFTEMLKEFSKVYNKDVKSLVEKNNLNFYDTVIMASIVEKETVKDKDRPIVAGVFYNRLGKKMKLQSDAVLLYGMPNRKKRVLYEDLKKDGPYNLYIHEGLPPTPISNPGVKSLIAAAEPAATEYLYFVTNVNGENSYSKTFEEHKKNAERFHKEAFGDKDSKQNNDK